MTNQEAMKQALEEYCKTLHPLWNTGISRAEAEGFFNAGFKAAEALAKQEHGVSDYDCRRLLYGFMLDCNAVGMFDAAENLHKGMKQAAHGTAPQGNDNK